jgi:ketosteroid isomerase-like protein
MKSLLAVLVLFLFATSLVVAQKTSALQAMVATEQAFSKTAEEKNTRDAFMAFIADDGLLFRPGAVNGKKWMLEHPVPPSDKKPLLAWQPVFAGMAAAGDLGFTTGPWEFKTDIKDEKPSGYGHFVTLWKKQSDGSWKFVVDLGITHPESGGPQKLWQPAANDVVPPFRSVDVDRALKALIERDEQFSSASVKQGLVNAFVANAAADVRLYRNNSLPFVGSPAAATALASTRGQVSWKPIGGDVSRSGDLGYTHGTYEVSSQDASRKLVERGSYVRIWKNQGGVWRVVLDVTNPQ